MTTDRDEAQKRVDTVEGYLYLFGPKVLAEVSRIVFAKCVEGIRRQADMRN